MALIYSNSYGGVYKDFISGKQNEGDGLIEVTRDGSYVRDRPLR